ncbi:MAG TPA: peptidylprolyl isomerase [Myxococcota bacterium]|nr:peptidylprolyl isomerase [Myxococcota bacterium]
MQATLSHGSPRPRRPSGPRRSGCARSRAGLALLLALGIGLGTACDETPEAAGRDESEAGADARSESAAAAPDGAETPAAAFDWPEDPSHPRLRIEVEGAGVEGAIEIELLPELAPKTVTHVLALAREGRYDGTTFHRVIPGFMIQGGDPYSRDRDPTNDGQGGMDRSVEDEFSDAPFVRGVVAMANRGRPDSNGSQLFIMHADQHGLDGRYSVIGRVRSGMAVVDAITEVETDAFGRWGPKDRPIENVRMTRVQAVEPLEPEPGADPEA